MPYINQKNRKEVKKQLDGLIKQLEQKGAGAENKVSRGDPEESLQTRLRREGSVQIRRGEQDIDGILNYIICKILLSIYNKKPGYYNYNRMMGVIECVKQELYRRVIGPYEDKKIKENGDII